MYMIQRTEVCLTTMIVDDGKKLERERERENGKKQLSINRTYAENE